MKTIFLVQGEHHTVPGNPMSAHATVELAAAAARGLVNIIRQDALYDPVTGDYSLILPQLEGEFDWHEALREWQRAKIADDYEPADIAGMDDDGLANATETDVWITELELEIPGDDPELMAADYKCFPTADPTRFSPALDNPPELAGQLRKYAWAKLGGHYTMGGSAVLAAADHLEKLPAGAADPERLHALDNARYPDDAPGSGCDDPALMGDGGAQ